MSNKASLIKVEISDALVSGNVVYSEEHSLTTNQLGLINLAIGQGVFQGNPLDSINWAASNYYLEIFIDPTGQGNFISMGLSQLLSVPYALYAKSSGNSLNAGAQGLQGPTGNKGITGARGLTGFKGAPGDQGAMGFQGLTGPQGITGNQGPVGKKGPDGGSGAQGPKGPTGADGAIGSMGLRGPTGPISLAGVNGAIPYEPFNPTILLSHAYLNDRTTYFVQFFAPSTGEYTHATLLADYFGNNEINGNVGVAIYSNQSGSTSFPNSGLPGTLIASGVNTYSKVDLNNKYIDFTFNSRAQLTANTLYWFAFSTDYSGGEHARLNLAYHTDYHGLHAQVLHYNNSFNGGSFSSTVPSQSLDRSEYSCWFRIYQE